MTWVSSYVERGYAAIRNRLHDAGFKHATPEMVKDVHEAMLYGRCSPDLPHGDVGAAAETWILQAPAMFGIGTTRERAR
jgi:hypothetical protein